MPTPSPSSLTISTTAFAEGGSIPSTYTCDGENRSPMLSISGVPAGTQTLTLMLEDPDAPMGTFTHWIVFNIDPKMTEIPSEITKTSPMFGTPGKNSAGGNDYVGPCPPSGTHRYIFTVYAVDTTLTAKAGATKEEVMAELNGHVIAEARLMGTYSRAK